MRLTLVKRALVLMFKVQLHNFIRHNLILLIRTCLEESIDIHVVFGVRMDILNDDVRLVCLVNMMIKSGCGVTSQSTNAI